MTGKSRTNSGPRKKHIRPRMDKKGKVDTKVLDADDGVKVPRTFVICKDVPREVNELMHNMRLVMSPNTAEKLKIRKKNVTKDFLHMAGPLGVTHLLEFNKTKAGTNLRVGRVPRGPTLTFRVENYTLIKDITTNIAKPKSPGNQYRTAPLLVLNNFSGEAVATQLVTTTFQNMFPSIDVATVDLKSLKRIVLFHNDPDNKVVHMRHYEIAVRPAGLSKSVKAVLRTKVPDLSQFNDISDFVLRGGDGYESDASNMGDDNKVTLTQNLNTAGNQAAKKSSIRLVELGPRMTLNLLKIEEGFCSGDVLFHSYIAKSDAEVKEMTTKREAAKKLKQSRIAEQLKNIAKKNEEKEENKKRSIAGTKRKYGAQDITPVEEMQQDPEQRYYDVKEDNDVSEDDDNQYYRDEVGAEPEKGLFNHNRKSKKGKAKAGDNDKQPSTSTSGGAGSKKRPNKAKNLSGPKPKSSKKRSNDGGGGGQNKKSKN